MRRFFFLALMLAVGCSSGGAATPASCAAPSTVTIGDQTLHVDLAMTDQERAKGLMGVTSMPADRGMAFVWDSPTQGTFWMKDTLIPLSIAWVDQSGRIVTIKEMTPCEHDPCPTYAADGPYVLAIEANAGWFDRHGIEVGDDVTLQRAGCS